MRSYHRGLLAALLNLFARLTLVRYRPFIVGVTGSVGKTSTKTAIFTVLKSDFKVRMAGGNLNNEIGLPLAILGDYDKTGGLIFWLKVFLKGLLQLILKTSYPKILVLEYGADRPGDIGYLVKIARPNAAVITAIGDVPVHIEFYKDRDEVIGEKAKLVQAVGAEGLTVLNFDDPEVLTMETLTKSKVLTYGFGEGANMKITNFENRSEFGKPLGVSFKLEYEGSFVPIKVENIFGRGQAYAVAAAACVGLIKGMNLVKIAEASALYEGVPGRARLISGIKDSYIIDDSYNASPLSMRASLEILEELKAPNKIAVLGDMLELGRFASYAHEEIGKILPSIANILITVGPRARFIAASARENGFPKKDIYEFDDSEEAKKTVHNLIEGHEVILVKGSQSMRMEKIVREIMVNPEEAGDLLVRQYGKWLK